MFKLSPDETLRIVQELYEKKLVTYPRTDARVLSTAVAKIIDKNIEDITTDDIRFYLARARKNGAKEITIDNYRRYLNSLFDWC